MRFQRGTCHAVGCGLILSFDIVLAGDDKGFTFSFLFDVSGGTITKAKPLESISDRYGLAGVVNYDCMLHLDSAILCFLIE